jgi:CspA family cold shock protein
MREIGRLKVYDPIKGFGFIERDKGKNVFVHYLQFDAKSDAMALIGSVVEFEVKVGEKGPRAYGVKFLS